MIESSYATPVEPNSKVRDGNWVDISGLTYLFGSSESEYEPYGPGISRMRTRGGDGLLDRLRIVAEALGPELRQQGINWLPSDTYHVTYRDIVCGLDLPDLPRAHAIEIGQLLERIPNDLRSVATALSLPTLSRKIDPINFRADKLAIWKGGVLVMKLIPADENSINRFESLCRDRMQENAEWSALYDRNFPSEYTPHVTLAYFSDLVVGRRLHDDSTMFGTCQSISRGIVEDSTITVDWWSLHAFVDMTTFIKLD